MGIGVSVFLIAVGAVLTFAVNWTTSGFSIHTVGIILMVCGAIGLLWSLLLFGRNRPYADAPYAEDRVITRDHVHDPHVH